MKVREGSQAVLAFPLTDADGNGARLANKRVELVIADKDSDKRETLVLNNQQESPWGKVTVSGENSTQILTVTGSSGSFKLRYNNETTDTLAYNATAAQVQAALAQLPSLGTNVRCSGGPLGTNPVTVEFTGNLLNVQHPRLQAVDVTGITVSITGQTTVYLKPGLRLFTAKFSPYKVYFRVIDPVEGIVTYPEDGSYFLTIEVEPSHLPL
jgi:hypothetical protein